MRGLQGVNHSLMASAAILSASILSIDALPPPFGSIVLGAGFGSLALVFQIHRGGTRSRKGEADLPQVPNRAQIASRLRPRASERTRVIGKYDKVFADMVGHRMSASTTASLERLKPLLYELSPEIRAWEPNVRLRIYLLMREIARGMDDPEFAKASLGALVMILSRGGQSAVEMARPLLRDRVATMYSNPQHQGERLLPRLMLLLDDYDGNALHSLASEAIHTWDNEKFWETHEFLGFEGLKDKAGGDRLKDMLSREIIKAGDDNDREALNRAMALYNGLGWPSSTNLEGKVANLANPIIS